MKRAGSTLLVSLSVCILSKFMSSLRGVNTITGDSSSAGLSTALPIWSLHISLLKDWTCYATVCLTFWARFCLPKTLISIQNILEWFFSPRKMFLWCSSRCMWGHVRCWVPVSTAAAHGHACWILLFTIIEMSRGILIECFVSTHMLRASRILIPHSQCGLRYASLRRFGAVSVSTKDVVDYSGFLFTAMPVRILDVGFAETATSVNRTLNSTAWVNMSVISD